jgi:hypothetical protein
MKNEELGREEEVTAEQHSFDELAGGVAIRNSCMVEARHTFPRFSHKQRRYEGGERA